MISHAAAQRRGAVASLRESFLEHELGAELDITRIVALRRHETESRIRRGCSAGIQTHARSEVRMIERIQRLGAKLNPATFTPLEILREPKIGN